MATRTATTMCRLCLATCGLRVTVEDGRAVRVAGDPDNPLSRGFTCIKGRSMAEQLNFSGRLLHPLARQADGSFEPVPIGTVVDGVAEALARLLETYGPRSVATYYGTGSAGYPATMEVSRAFVQAIGSPMAFAPATIDQPGKQLATSFHGRWGGHAYTFETADVWMFVGTNPIVSMWGGMTVTDPLRLLQRAKRSGLRLITVDPRRTELAALSDVHLRPRPGEDAVLLAGLVRAVLTGGHQDDEFCERHVRGVADLAQAVEPFTPETVAARTGVPPEHLAEAIAVLAGSRRGGITAGTGANMTPLGTLTEYLLIALHTLCGYWRRAGEVVTNPGVLIEEYPFVAQAEPAPPPIGREGMRATPLRQTSAGMPTAALPDEMLLEGPDRVRALICLGGNPVAAWPDQLKVIEAMKALELLVCFDVRMSATARLAHYVVGSKFMIEVPQVTGTERGLRAYGATSSLFPGPYAMYSPAIVDPPPGSEVVEEWEVLLAVAGKLGLPLEVHGERLEPGDRPTTDELYEIIFAGTRVPLSEVKRHEHGHVFDELPTVRVSAPERDNGLRLEAGHPVMLEQLADLAAAAPPARPSGMPYLLTSRRMKEAKNSSGLDIPMLRRRHRTNPAFMHPDDLAELDLADGDAVEIRSARASIPAIVAADPNVLPGMVSIAHAWGDGPDRDGEFREIGSSTGRLVDNVEDIDPITGMPRMTALPVAVVPAPR